MRLYEQLRIPQSWAIEAFGKGRLVEALHIAERQILQRSFGELLKPSCFLSDRECELVDEAVHACEIAALEWWQAARYPSEDQTEELRKFSDACTIAFTLVRSLPVPNLPEARASHILRCIALGYLADRHTDVQRWICDTIGDDMTLSLEGWDGLLASKILETWVRLVRRESWDEVNQIAGIISFLRHQQHEYEREYLGALDRNAVTSAAIQLVSFYHWAKATDVLAAYMLQGTPADAGPQIDLHFEKAVTGADVSGSFELGNLLRWLHLASHRLLKNAVWNVSQRFNSSITEYVRSLTSSQKTTLELLPPQRRAIFECGLLDRTHNAVVVSLPTSSGKTQLAVFRILEAVNHFGQQKGWIAYTAPTRALVNQITARLRRELACVNVRVEHISAALDVDQLEEEVLGDESAFDVLVCTPEKLDVIIRQGRVKRDLVLLIMDEAHSIEDESRGLKHELLLAMVKRDCPLAKFLLLTPFVSNGMELARWLDPQSPNAISMSLDWQPNDRVIGRFYAVPGTTPRGWQMQFESIATSHPSLGLDSPVYVGDPGPLPKSFSKVRGCLTTMSCAMAVELCRRGTSLVITQQKPHAWSAAVQLKEVLPRLDRVAPDVEMVMRFIEAEYGKGHELCKLLQHGIAVHHAGLSDECRFLIEWLTEQSHLKVLCATTTIAQGINFPVNSILISSLKYPRGKEMGFREFWNLAGRAGRLGQPGVGLLIGIASTSDYAGQDEELRKYVQDAHKELLSSLLALYDEASKSGSELDLHLLAPLPTWSAFMQYLAHLFNQSGQDSRLETRLELILRDTYGYMSLERSNPDAARKLVEAARRYVRRLEKDPGSAKLAEDTGFAPDNVRIALAGLGNEDLRLSDWKPDQLFSKGTTTLRDLMGVMLRIPELSQLREIPATGVSHRWLAALTVDWVNGRTLRELAQAYFDGTDMHALTKCCDAIYGNLVTNVTWGIAALQKLGIDFEQLDPDERRLLNTLPSMVYYGVNTEDAVLMRMAGVSRTLAHNTAAEFRRQYGLSPARPRDAFDWLSALDAGQWGRIAPSGYPMTGGDCLRVWRRLNGLGE
ncbi:MAG: DEAD/DEAH box helicase [Firmicutes bacterium]|nr:DEAD/DEAH box helicase [Bacillota bacterium]